MKIIYFFFFILFLNNVYGFGVSPGSFSIEIKNNEEIEKEFFIYNNENELKKYNITGIGFFNFTDFILDVEENSEKEFKFLIKVPYETFEGTYSGRIYVKELNKEEGGVNLDALLGIKFEFLVQSNYTELEERSFKQRLEFKEISENEIEELEEEFGIEIILFYVLVILVLLLCIYRICINFKK